MTVADMLLWKKWCGGAVILTSTTALWYLFERADYNFLSFVANVLLLLVLILFVWAKSASLLNRYFDSSFCQLLVLYIVLFSNLHFLGGSLWMRYGCFRDDESKVNNIHCKREPFYCAKS